MNVDPLSEDYVYNSTYAFQENKMGMGRELEGLELVNFGWSDIFLFSETPTTTSPLMNTVKVSLETAGKATETMVEVSETTSAATRLAQNSSRGRATEVEQLAKNGYEKNTQKFTRIDPKTGKEESTIPEAVKPSGGTVEIKNVQRQSLTRQLRLQKEVSNENGVKPELIINEGAKVSKPVKNNFDIQYYKEALPVRDNIRVNMPSLPRNMQAQPKKEYKTIEDIENS